MGFLRQSTAYAVPVAALVLTFGIAPSFAQHPPLSDVARKESERRKEQKPARKVYTNKDLPPSARGRDPVPPAGETGAAAAVPVEEPEQKPDPAAVPGGETKDEAWWKARILSAREELRRNEMFAEALQSRINALSRDFVNRDNPVQRRQVGEERAEALTELSRVEAEIERGRKAIDDIQEEARQAGVPAGWLR